MKLLLCERSEVSHNFHLLTSGEALSMKIELRHDFGECENVNAFDLRYGIIHGLCWMCRLALYYQIDL